METELYHHGILGMKWGIRRYQNVDGSLTQAGKERYLKSIANGGKLYDEKASPLNFTNRAYAATTKSVKKEIAEFKKEYGQQIEKLDAECGNVKKNFESAPHGKYATIANLANELFLWNNSPTLDDLLQDLGGAMDDNDDQAMLGYAISTGQEQQVRKFIDKSSELMEQFQNNVRDTVINKLGTVDVENISPDLIKKGQERLASVIGYESRTDEIYGDFDFYASFYPDETDPHSDKYVKAINESAKFVNKLDSQCFNPYYGWEKLYKAIEKLDWEDKKLAGLTNAQWDRLNETIRKM